MLALAVAATAATREYPDRHITLRHKNSVVARWSGPQH
jgi:hypothetical protein